MVDPDIALNVQDAKSISFTLRVEPVSDTVIVGRARPYGGQGFGLWVTDDSVSVCSGRTIELKDEQSALSVECTPTAQVVTF